MRDGGEGKMKCGVAFALKVRLFPVSGHFGR